VEQLDTYSLRSAPWLEWPHLCPCFSTTPAQQFVSDPGKEDVFQPDPFPAQLPVKARGYSGRPAWKERQGAGRGAAGFLGAAGGIPLPRHRVGLSCACAKRVV